MLKVTTVFRILAVLTMAAVFLSGLFVIYLPFPFRVPHFYLLMWIPMLMLYDHKLVFNKNLLWVVVFLLTIFLGSGLFWEERLFADDNRRVKSILFEAVSIYGAALLYLYFLKSGDKKGLQIVIFSALTFIAITTILSIKGLNIAPMAVRFAMAGQLDDIDLAIRNLGIGGYGFFNGVMLLLPALAFFLSKPGFGLWKKAFILLFAAFTIYPMFLGGITTTMLLAVLFFVYAAYFRKP